MLRCVVLSKAANFLNRQVAADARFKIFQVFQRAFTRRATVAEQSKSAFHSRDGIGRSRGEVFALVEADFQRIDLVKQSVKTAVRQAIFDAGNIIASETEFGDYVALESGNLVVTANIGCHKSEFLLADAEMSGIVAFKKPAAVGSGSVGAFGFVCFIFRDIAAIHRENLFGRGACAIYPFVVCEFCRKAQVMQRCRHLVSFVTFFAARKGHVFCDVQRFGVAAELFFGDFFAAKGASQSFSHDMFLLNVIFIVPKTF